VAFLALLAASLIARRRIAVGRLEWAFLGALAAYAGWMELSQLWSDTPANSVLEGERAFLYVCAVAAVLLSMERSNMPVLLAGSLAGATALCAYALTKYLAFGHELDPYQGDLLFLPIGYANALGIYAVIGILLALGLALSGTGWWRLAAASVVVLGPTLYLTKSRAASFALALGLFVLLAFAPRVPKRVVAAFAGLAVVFVAVVVVVAADASGVAGRLFGENRPRYWRVAADQYADNPVLGSGAGTFDRYILADPDAGTFARDPHNLYLASLAELGPVGLALIVTAFALPLVALRRGRDPLLATAAGGYVAFIVHAGVDWDWELPAVTLGGLLCGTALLAGVRPPDAPELGWRLRLALLAAAAAFAALSLVRLDRGPGLPWTA
jgi:O-antigen ligase